MANNENIRSVELPALPEVKEGEWWWAIVFQWLRAEPLERLYVQPHGVGDGNGQWGRIEQRAQSMLLASLPTSLKGETLANRATSSVQVLFRIFTRYQPGGLGERAMLLRQLVDPRTSTSMLEALEQLRAWKRYLRRAQELKIATPDATLLVGALEKYVGVIVKASPQTSFRLNSARAGLRVDVAPVVDSVLQFADVVLAEAEAGFHSTAQGTAAKVTDKPKDFGKGGGKGKEGRLLPRRRRAGSSSRIVDARREQIAPTSMSSTRALLELWRNLTHPKRLSGEDAEDSGWKWRSQDRLRDRCEGPDRQEGGNGAAVSTTGGWRAPSRSVNGPLPDGGRGEAVRGLIQEAAGLLKSLELRKIQLSSLEVKNKRALLDGGAMHSLRQCSSVQEWDKAREVEVHLAQGTLSLRLIPWTRTLLTMGEVQPIVVKWEGDRFWISMGGCLGWRVFYGG